MKKIIAIFMVMTFLFVNTLPVNAASARCTISGNTTVTVGSTVKVNVKITGSRMYMVQGSISSSQSSVLSGAGKIYKKADLSNPSEANGVSSVSTSVTFTAKSVGKATISFEQNINNCLNVDDENISISGGSLTINVVEKKQETPSKPSSPSAPSVDDRSKENGLSSLSVNTGTLSPEFNSSTTQYTVNVEANTSKITINAKAKDSKAKISGIGEKTLKVGKNSFEVICTAENGSEKSYKIDVNVDEKPLVYLDFDNQKLGVVRNLDGVGSPNGFEKTTIKINDQEIDAWINKKINMVICYLANEKGDKAFYIVEDGKVSNEFKSISIDERIFYVLPIEDKMKNRDGFEFKTVKINENIEIDGWVYKDEAMKNYVQLYLMNEAGEKHTYDYETTEKQLQIYTEQTVAKSGINIFMITTGVFVLTSAGLLYLYLNFKKKSISAIKDYYQNKGQ